MTTISLTLEPDENGKCVYRPGQSLKGFVALSLSGRKKFRGLFIKIFGQAKTSFMIPKMRRPINCEGVEVYLNSSIYLFGRKDGPTFELQPGTHKYKFSCQLPEHLPSSTSLRHGSIEYFIEAVLDVPWSFDKDVKTSFILDCDDLNSYASLREPVRRVEVKNISAYESVCVTVMIPCSGFVANQIVPINIFSENNSNANILRTRVTLIQSLEYKSTDISEVKTENHVVVEDYGEGVNARNRKNILTNIKIPPVATSNTKYCRIITVKYHIEVEPELCGVNANFKIEIPIIIGTTPIRFDGEGSAANYPSAPPKEQFSEELPPSYAEIMKFTA